MNEEFVRIDGYAFPYFVSNMGRVKKENGFFLKPMMMEGSEGYFVHLKPKVVPDNHYKYKLISLAALVLDAFNGGYAKNRQVIYKDGDKKNCRLDNLSWKYGWNGEIDLSEIGEVTGDDKFVYDYLKTKDMLHIYNLIEKHRFIIKIICEERGGKEYYEDIKIELFLSLKRIFDSGRYKPGVNSSMIGLLRKIIIIYIRDTRIVNTYVADKERELVGDYITWENEEEYEDFK